MKEKNDLFTEISEKLSDQKQKQILMSHIQTGSKRLRLWLLRSIVKIEGAFKSLSRLFTGRARNKPIDPVLLSLILLVKEILGFTSEQAVLDALKTDSELQEILGIKDASEVPCRRTLIRFKNRLRDYENQMGENLMEKEIIFLMNTILKNRLRSGYCVLRIDSTTIEAFLRKTTRMGLIYTTVAALVKEMDKKKLTIPDSLKHYLNSREYNRWFYHKNRAKGVPKAKARKDKKRRSKKIKKTLLKDIQTILEMDETKFKRLSYYQIFKRMVDEQTYLTKEGKRRLKGGNELNSRTLQSPFDPDATYRKKASKDHVGYVINFVEIVSLDADGKILSRNIIYFQVEKNIYSDVEFLKDFLEQCQFFYEELYLVADGAYYSYENEVLAQTKNLRLIPTEMTGKETNPFLAEFKLSEDGREFISCPGSTGAKTATYNENTEQIYLSFPIKTCKNCPYRKQCKPNYRTRVATLFVSKKSVARAKMQKNMRSQDLSFLSDIRNGVESVPSQLKNTYHINSIRRRGLSGTKLAASLKTFALSLAKLTDTWLSEYFEKTEFIGS